MSRSLPLGAHYQGEQQCSFCLWAPELESAEVHVLTPSERRVPLRKDTAGYFSGFLEGIQPGARYYFRLNGREERPDPGSRFQPEGVHGPSEITDPEFPWEDQGWFGLPLRDYVFYELHVGTFTDEGTFDAIIPQVPELRDLGVTALELMPVAQFPGKRNWGYDGVYPFAVQDSYGGPAGLKRLVNAAHQHGLAIVLDVVYNHLGPEGNYLREFGPYFTDRYKTPWGSALNFDGEHNQGVRRFFLENALHWQTEFHVDALRLDAVHAIKDFSAKPFLQELAEQTRRRSEELNRRFFLIAESDLNDRRLISPELAGGYGLDAQWSDDFHHCLHVLLTGEREGYYADFGGTGMLSKIFREGYAYTGEYSAYRKRAHGNAPRLNSSKQFVVFSQNHDQVGNRLHGERLSRLADLEALKLAAASVLLSPFLPLLFMGEEYGEPAPFQYMTSHTDPQLVEAVRQGRREEFAGFAWSGEVPDPQAESTFHQCVLQRDLVRTEPSHAALWQFYRELLRLRREVPAIASADKLTLKAQAWEPEKVLSFVYPDEDGGVFGILCFASAPQSVEADLAPGTWKKLLDSSEQKWGGPRDALSAPDKIASGGRAALHLRPKSVVLYQQTRI